MKAEHAWLALGAGVITYELLCKEGELLSEAVDRAIEKHPISTRAFIGMTALHLANILPPKLDPIHMGHRGINRYTRNYLPARY